MIFFCEEIPQKPKLQMSEILSCDKFSHRLQVSVNMICWALPVLFTEALCILCFQILTHHFSLRRFYNFTSFCDHFLSHFIQKPRSNDFFFSLYPFMQTQMLQITIPLHSFLFLLFAQLLPYYVIVICALQPITWPSYIHLF